MGSQERLAVTNNQPLITNNTQLTLPSSSLNQLSVISPDGVWCGCTDTNAFALGGGRATQGFN